MDRNCKQPEFYVEPENECYRTPEKGLVFNVIDSVSGDYKRKTEAGCSASVLECGGRDSNSHRLTPTTPSKSRVYHFTTTALFWDCKYMHNFYNSKIFMNFFTQNRTFFNFWHH